MLYQHDNDPEHMSTETAGSENGTGWLTGLPDCSAFIALSKSGSNLIQMLNAGHPTSIRGLEEHIVEEMDTLVEMVVRHLSWPP